MQEECHCSYACPNPLVKSAYCKIKSEKSWVACEYMPANAKDIIGVRVTKTDVFVVVSDEPTQSRRKPMILLHNKLSAFFM